MKTTKAARLLLVFSILFLYSCVNKENKQPNNESKVEPTVDTRIDSKKQQAMIVAKLDNGKIVLTNKRQVMSMLQKKMTSDQVSKMDMNSLRIDISKATDNEKIEIVQIVINSKDETAKTSYLLERKPNGFEVSTTATSITCKGCTVGCSPKRAVDGTAYCTDCYATDGKCEKTETLPATAGIKK